MSAYADFLARKALRAPFKGVTKTPELAPHLFPFQVRLLFDREELLGAITRASLTADSREHSVLLVGRDGRLSASSQSAVGEVMDEIAYEGGDFQIAVISTVLVPVLSSFDCEMVEIGYRDHNSAITIHDRKDASRLALAMPYRDQRLAEFINNVPEAA